MTFTKCHMELLRESAWMIVDCTGIILTPGNMGRDCRGNGSFIDENGTSLECCCDECDYLQCCFGTHRMEMCKFCADTDCPRASLSAQ